MGLIFAGLLAAVFAVFSSVSKPPPAPQAAELSPPKVVAIATARVPERPVDHLPSVLGSPIDEDDLALEHARPIQLQGDSAMQAPTETVAGNLASTQDGCTLPGGQMRQNCASFGAEPIVLNLKRELWLSTIHR
jgi:hypothetical protein